MEKGLAVLLVLAPVFSIPIATIPEIILGSRSSIIYACDYISPIVSIPYQSSSMPCSSIYTNSSALNNFQGSFEAAYIEAIDKQRTISARKCFKLKLVTWCKQRWLRANEIGRRTETQLVTRDECFGSKVCQNCEISSQYPSEKCETFTFGESAVDRTVVFSSSVVVFQNMIGECSYGGIKTINDYFELGGDYKEIVFFTKLPDESASRGNFLLNPESMEILSYGLRRLLPFSNKTVSFNSTDWYLYDSNHLIEKAPVDAAQNQLKGSRKLQADLSPRRSRSSARLLQVKTQLWDQSYTAYNQYYLNAQINVTTWYLNYLDCRLKKLAFGTQQALGLLISKKDLGPLISDEVLDLGPGEQLKEGQLIKFKCSRVTFGRIIAANKCLIYELEGKRYNISNTGEIVMRSDCRDFLRLNSSSIISATAGDMIEIRESSFPSLFEEENVLQYTPVVTSSASYISELIKNSSTLNVWKSEMLSAEPTSVTQSGSFNLIDKIAQLGLFKWLSLGSMVIVYVLILALLIFWLLILSKNPRRRENSQEAELNPQPKEVDTGIFRINRN